MPPQYRFKKVKKILNINIQHFRYSIGAEATRRKLQPLQCQEFPNALTMVFDFASLMQRNTNHDAGDQGRNSRVFFAICENFLN